jgi:hypothetical protein
MALITAFSMSEFRRNKGEITVNGFYFADEYDEDYVGYCDWCDAEVGDAEDAVFHNIALEANFECYLCGYCPWHTDNPETDQDKS